jgi:hypothetical protein
MQNRRLVYYNWTGYIKYWIILWLFNVSQYIKAIFSYQIIDGFVFHCKNIFKYIVIITITKWVVYDIFFHHMEHCNIDLFQQVIYAPKFWAL